MIADHVPAVPARLHERLLRRADRDADGVRDYAREVSALRDASDPSGTTTFLVRRGDVLPRG